jgi:hypothetical protein
MSGGSSRADGSGPLGPARPPDRLEQNSPTPRLRVANLPNVEFAGIIRATTDLPTPGKSPSEGFSPGRKKDPSGASGGCDWTQPTSSPPIHMASRVGVIGPSTVRAVKADSTALSRNIRIGCIAKTIHHLNSYLEMSGFIWKAGVSIRQGRLNEPGKTRAGVKPLLCNPLRCFRRGAEESRWKAPCISQGRSTAIRLLIDKRPGP